jgi:DNA repair protein RecO (recombination protein O)
VRTDGEDALVVHVRTYRETSVIARFFTASHGMIGVVGKGVKGARGSRRGAERLAELQPFNRVRISWVGGRGLATLTQIEMTRRRLLHGSGLAAGFYVLELLSRLMQEHDPHPRLYHTTHAVLDAIEAQARLSMVLRRFERELLTELGFGVDFCADLEGRPIVAEQTYRLEAGEGFAADSAGAYSGAVLAAIDANDYSGGNVRHAARHLFRELLEPHLGGRPRTSRTLLGTPSR